MKYKVGNNVLLYSGETVNIFSVDTKNREYSVVNDVNLNDIRIIKEKDIYMLVV